MRGQKVTACSMCDSPHWTARPLWSGSPRDWRNVCEFAPPGQPRAIALDEVFYHRGVFQRADAEPDHAELSVCGCICCERAGLESERDRFHGSAAAFVQLSATALVGWTLAKIVQLSNV